MVTSETQTSFVKKHGLSVFCGLLYMVFSGFACAAGVDTGSSSMTSLQTWLDTWIPLAATILIVVTAIGWMAHMVQMTTAVRLGLGLIVIGSASYLVSLFGLTSA
ncbi:TrbC/VirB2 family protein [Pseudomonas sp. Marseille-Q5115]|uniref:TrbC/VirB2 family protein n=1 Tax=Pseudomonas sp. Marseille-Q5115 TaxID=2866593 RepID=UPI001CE4A64C|nr:TrbC/VirB2 family protein [Pseudomonas sp. Marseille-Q5115]